MDPHRAFRACLVTSLALTAAVSLAACASSTSKASTTASTPVQTAPVGPPATTAPNTQCGAMDAILVEALDQTPEGQAYTGLPEGSSSEDTQSAWNAFTQVLETNYHARLQTAAGGDATATSAVTALTTYTATTSRFADGQIPEFKDESQAEKDIKEGRTPEPNPEYQKSMEARTNAHVELSTCMPHWPVTF
ncbi:hypothetical protein HMPREF0975_02009 [Actinomyces sp. oral taxon 849 str. F0330]|uniref:hypothetical protein n=1 Tax=Actinomyces sp. oral taxon 849 TaxID=653385 RepID=UPI00024301DB|nr:hypothetical protein [Actinomyces sp. oral taxon 849]EHM93190.1 hypothetical protein HMPREF0975_02009 [Actinomyces sp. oral taxon 849 str. F0330]